MDILSISIAQACLNAAYDGTLAFPLIVGRLIEAGFEGYSVDYRSSSQTYYLPSGESLTLDTHYDTPEPIAEAFNAETMAALVRWAQTDCPDYSYQHFCKKAAQAGCAGYLVSFSGRRVVYYGRTGETHVEHFPQ